MKIGLFLAEKQAFLGIEIVKVTENRLKSHIVKMADSFRKMPVGDLLQTAISFFLINIFSNGFQFCIQLEKTLLLMYVTTLSDEKQNLVAGRYLLGSFMRRAWLPSFSALDPISQVKYSV